MNSHPLSMKTGPNYYINFMCPLSVGLSFDIRHLFERDVYQCASSGICVHYVSRKFSAMCIRDCESFTA